MATGWLSLGCILDIPRVRGYTVPRWVNGYTWVHGYMLKRLIGCPITMDNEV